MLLHKRKGHHRFNLLIHYKASDIHPLVNSQKSPTSTDILTFEVGDDSPLLHFFVTVAGQLG